ncbi:MAG: cytochrome b [Betaproteobacteria bacterium]|nr:cytochrome b [Betaproteobacteria bacterium]
MKTERFTSTAITLHWLVAAMMVISVAIGLYMTGLKLSPDKLKLYSWHKWVGVTIFMLVAIRAAWRLSHASPPMPASMPAWQRHTANAAHILLYVLMFAIPLSGWLMSSAKGFQTVYFGVIPLPDLLGKNEALGELLQEVHRLLNYTFIAIVAVHVAAALKHHFIDKDDVMQRMLPHKAPQKETHKRA